MEKILKFNIDKVNIVKEASDSQLAILEIYVCRSGLNLHDMPISLGSIKEAVPTLFNKFLVAGYNGYSDFKGHESNEEIIGFFPAENDIRFEKADNGKDYYLVANAIMSKMYAGWAYKVFKNKDNKRDVSMEITVIDSMINQEGQEEITSFVFNGVTILGAGHSPASPGSHATIIKFEELKEKGEQFYHSFSENKSKHRSSLKGNDFYLKSLKGDDKVAIKQSEKEFAVGEDLGKSPAIKINNSKESAVMSGSWSDPGAGMLDKLLKASNHASLIKEAYLIIDGNSGGDLSVNDVHYPHHSIKGGQLVVNKRGVQAAFARLRQQGVGGSAVAHIKKHYKELGLDMKNFESFGLTRADFLYLFEKEVDSVARNKTVFAKAQEFCKGIEFEEESGNKSGKYAVLEADAEFVYCYDKEAKKVLAVPFRCHELEEEFEEEEEAKKGFEEEEEEEAKKDFEDEDEKDDDKEDDDKEDEKDDEEEDDKDKKFEEEEFELKFEEAKPAKAKIKYEAKFEEEEKEEDFEEEEFEEALYAVMMAIGSKKFTSDENTEGVAQAALNKKEEEGYNELVDEANKAEPEKDPATVELELELESLKKEFATTSEEVEKLRDFRSNVLEQQKMEAVNFALKEVEDIMPQEEIDKFRESSKEFSLDEIDSWKNALKAQAFNFSKERPTKEKFTKFSFPFTTDKVEKDSIWNTLKSKN